MTRVLGSGSALLAAMFFAAAPGVVVAQSGKAAVSAMARALADQAQRQIDADTEIEIARRKAEIEIEAERRKDEYRRSVAAQQAAKQSAVEVAMGELDRSFPGWGKLARSTAYGTWVRSMPESYQGVCRTTTDSRVFTSCLNDFLNSRVVPADR